VRDLLGDEEALGTVFVGIGAPEEFTEDGVVPDETCEELCLA
jgi:hypothetical protein